MILGFYELLGFSELDLDPSGCAMTQSVNPKLVVPISATTKKKKRFGIFYPVDLVSHWGTSLGFFTLEPGLKPQRLTQKNKVTFHDSRPIVSQSLGQIV